MPVLWLQDGQMAYKQALAFHATGDVRHAETAQRTMAAWASVNKIWGLQYENGPLGAYSLLTISWHSQQCGLAEGISQGAC